MNARATVLTTPRHPADERGGILLTRACAAGLVVVLALLAGCESADSTGNSGELDRCALLTDGEIEEAIGSRNGGTTGLDNQWCLQSCRWTAKEPQKVEGYPDGWFDAIKVAVFEEVTEGRPTANPWSGSLRVRRTTTPGASSDGSRQAGSGDHAHARSRKGHLADFDFSSDIEVESGTVEKLETAFKRLNGVMNFTWEVGKETPGAFDQELRVKLPGAVSIPPVHAHRARDHGRGRRIGAGVRP